MTARYVIINGRQLCCYKNAASPNRVWALRQNDGEWSNGFPIKKQTMRGILAA
jgi:hypothetical protein